MTTWSMCVGFGVVFFFAGVAIGWLIGWSVGFRVGTDEERGRWMEDEVVRRWIRETWNRMYPGTPAK